MDGTPGTDTPTCACRHIPPDNILTSVKSIEKCIMLLSYVQNLCDLHVLICRYDEWIEGERIAGKTTSPSKGSGRPSYTKVSDIQVLCNILLVNYCKLLVYY